MEHIQRLAIIALINLVVYYRTLFYGYVGDDIERSERQQEFKNRFHRWWLQFIGLKHTNSMVAHFLTLLTHTACCLMIYLALGRNNISFLTALLFSINPINIQGSVWISGRNYVISAILALGMFLLPHLSWAFYAATSHFAVNAWFAPLAFLGTKYWYMAGIIPLVWIITQNNRNTLNRKLWQTGGLKTTNTEMRTIKFKKLIILLKTYFYYFVLAIFPHTLGIEHNFLRGFGTNQTDNKKGYKLDKFFWLGLFLATGVAIISTMGIFSGWRAIRGTIIDYNGVCYGLFWFSTNIAMWCNLVTYQQQIAERYLYLANIGMMYAVANIIINYPVFIAIFLTGYFIRLWYIMDMYLNDNWAVEYSIMESKNMYYMWLMRGVKKFTVRDYVGAAFDFNEAYHHKPYDLKVLYNLATTMFILHDITAAKNFLEKAKVNVYDELDEVVKPAFDNLEGLIKQVEDAREKGETQVQLDMNKLIVVK